MSEAENKVGDNKVTEDQVWEVETWISYLLRGGVLLCGLVIAIGWVLHLVQGNSDVLHELFQGHNLNSSLIPVSATQLFDQLSRVDPKAIMTLGLRILIVLPIIRVFFTLLIFIIQRDFIFIFLSSTVLVFLLFGLIGGRGL